jgi:hypothetical protein
MLGAGEGLLGIASGVPALGIGAVKSLLGNDGKSYMQNVGESVYTPRTELGRGVVEKFSDVAKDIPPYIPVIGPAASEFRLIGAAQKEAQLAKEVAAAKAATAAAAAKKVELPRLPGATTSAAEAKVAAPRLQASTPVEGPPGQMLTPEAAEAARIDKAAADWTAARALREDKKAAAEGRAARQPGGLDDVARLKQDQANAANTGIAATQAAENARLGPLKVQDATLRAADAAEDARYAQGVADRTGKAGRLGLASAAGLDASSNENMPSGLGAAINPADLSKDDKKGLIDTAKATVPADERKKTGFGDDDWMMLGLQLLANNAPGVPAAIGWGKAGIATLGNKKEREKLEREQENQEFVNKYRGAETEKALAEADYYKGLKGPQAALTLGQTEHKNWLGTMAAKMATPEEIATHEQQAIVDAFKRLGLPLPAGMMAGATALPQDSTVKKIG